MIRRALKYLRRARAERRAGLSLARAAASAPLRDVDLSNPSSWEFSGFSQNGEDGILDLLCRHLRAPQRYFVEIGAADGLENNTSWIAAAHRYSGLMIEGNPRLSAQCALLMEFLAIGVECQQLFVNRDNVDAVLRHVLVPEPDVFSLDIDGMDYHVAKALFATEFRPNIVVVEYNSAFGPDKSLTLPYTEWFDYRRAHPTELYYGASLSAWRSFFSELGYRFLTVEQNGVNAFFARPAAFAPEFLGSISGLEFAENFYQRRKFPGGWREQLRLIDGLELISTA